MSIEPYAPPKFDHTDAPPVATAMSEEESALIAGRLRSLNNRSLGLGGLGLAVQAVGGVVDNVPVRLAGTILLIIGLSFYARMRGHSPWLGLLGLLSCIGAVVLVLLPKRCFKCTAPIKKTRFCHNCGAPAPL